MAAAVVLSLLESCRSVVGSVLLTLRVNIRLQQWDAYQEFKSLCSLMASRIGKKEVRILNLLEAKFDANADTTRSVSTPSEKRCAAGSIFGDRIFRYLMMVEILIK